MTVGLRLRGSGMPHYGKAGGHGSGGSSPAFQAKRPCPRDWGGCSYKPANWEKWMSVASIPAP